MAIDPILLPEEPTALCRVVNDHYAREQRRISMRRLMWLLIYWYLQGARKFTAFDPTGQVISATALDEEGRLEFQSQEVLAIIDKVAGRLSSLDLRPMVSRVGYSLAAIRERSVGQIIADNLISPDQLEVIKPQFMHILTALGCCGIQGHILDLPTVGLTADLEIIHPRELCPFPSLGPDYTKQRGLMRYRYVPITFLDQKYGKRFITPKRPSMDLWQRQIGEALHDNDQATLPTTLRSQLTVTPTAYQPDPSDYQVEIALIKEIWTYGPRDLVDRYVCVCGNTVLSDQSFEDFSTYCPIGTARFYENGTFHGLGVFDLIYAYAREFETMAKQLFNNIKDIDKYGFIVMPQGQFNQQVALRDVGRGLRVLPYEPDPSALDTNFKPFSVQPFNSGDVPGKTAAFAKQALDSISPLPDLLREKGRVDSANGLQFLDEQINRSLSTVSRNIQISFGGMYRAAITKALATLTKSPRPLPLSRLDTDLAGAVIDPKNNTVSFTENPIPSVTTLRFGVKETAPSSGLAAKTEALQLFQAQLMTPTQFKIYCVKEGIDLAMDLSDVQAAVESVTLNILLVFGDGQTPGQAVITPNTARPEIQLYILDAFMGAPRTSMASVEVQDALSDYREALQQFMQSVLPAQVPTPDGAAMMSQQASSQTPYQPA